MSGWTDPADHADIGAFEDNDETPAQTPVSRELGGDLDRRLLALLRAHQGARGICPTVARQAELLGVSESSVQRARRRLQAAGLVERIDVFERDDDPEWQRRRRAGEAGITPRRQTRNAYRVTPGVLAPVTPAPGVTGFPQAAAQTPVSPVDGDTPEGKESAALRKVPLWERAKAGMDRKMGRVPAEDATGPTRAELLATLEGAFGPVEVLAEWRNGELPPRSVRRWRTREEYAADRRAAKARARRRKTG